MKKQNRKQKNDWLAITDDATGTEDAVKRFLDLGKSRLQEASALIEHGGHVELTELMASVVAMLASASQRKKDVALRRKVVKRIRSLIELMIDDEVIRETDPGDWARAVSACERLSYQAGLHTLRAYMNEQKREALAEEMAEEHEEERQKQEKVRAELAAKRPMDGVDQDLEDEPDA